VDFTHHSGLVAGSLQVFGEIGLLPIEILDVVHLSIDKTVLSGEHHRPTGSTYGVGHKTFIKQGALLGNSVNVGRVVQIMSVGTYGLKSVIIGHDKNDIWWLWFFLLTRKKKWQKKNEKNQFFHWI
jgi:hypothetical protein